MAQCFWLVSLRGRNKTRTMTTFVPFVWEVPSAVMTVPLLPDALWNLIEPLLPVPPPRPNGGRPRVPDRASLTGILSCYAAGFRGRCCRRSWAADRG